jgi:superfamily I DNA and/or RNA helicase
MARPDGERARIGTVDKFQGREAPIVIYSITTSTHADAPRGINFLYSLNRLNVATSREGVEKFGVLAGAVLSRSAGRLNT